MEGEQRGGVGVYGEADGFGSEGGGSEEGGGGPNGGSLAFFFIFQQLRGRLLHQLSRRLAVDNVHTPLHARPLPRPVGGEGGLRGSFWWSHGTSLSCRSTMALLWAIVAFVVLLFCTHPPDA